MIRVTEYYRALRKHRNRLRDVDAAALESAIEDFGLEESFARHYLNEEVRLIDFPYYSTYVDAVKSETQMMKEPKRILFVGSGPVPLSPILFAKEFPNAKVDVMDIDRVALATGIAVAEKAGVHLEEQIIADATKFKNYGRYDAIVISLEAGPTNITKRAILKNLFKQLDSDTVVLLRGSRDTGGSRFVNTRKLLPSDTVIEDAAITFNGYGETTAVRVRKI